MAPRVSVLAVLCICVVNSMAAAVQPEKQAPDLFEVENDAKTGAKAVPATSQWRPENMGVIPVNVAQAIIDSQFDPLPMRMQKISESLLNRGYAIDPLGEGTGPDPDPLVRYDHFDCLTFVEEVLALSHTSAGHLASSTRLNLRYSSVTPSPLYGNRNHFMEMQWIPQAIRSGWLRDITASFEGVTSRQRKITSTTWKDWRQSRHFQMSIQNFPIGDMELRFVPLEAMKTQLKKIPSGSLILVVRENLSHKPIWISHVGIVIQNQSTIIRHATKLGKGKVKDNSLQWYLKHIGTYKNWRTSGLVILEPIEFGPRLSRLKTE